MATNKIDLVNKHIDALGRGDWNTWRGLVADQCVYEEEATHRHVDSADQWLAITKEWRNAFPDLQGTVKQSIASGDGVVVEVEWRGTHKASLAGPFGVIPATGRTGMVPAVMVIRFDGDKIREARHYFDLMTLLGQLGALPQPQPPQPMAGH